MICPPPAWCAANCAAWHKAREDRHKGTGCGAMLLDRERGCINKEWAAKVRKGGKNETHAPSREGG